MPFEPIIILQRLAPKEISKYLRPKQPLPESPQRNAPTVKKNEESNAQSSKKDLIGNNSGLSLEKQQHLTNSSPKPRALIKNGIHHDSKHNDERPHEILPKQQNRLKSYGGITFTDNSDLEPDDLFKKELVVVIDNCFNNVMRDIMVNSTIHPKIRNLTVASNSSTASNNSATSTRGLPDYKAGCSLKVTDSVNINTIKNSRSSKSPPSTVTPVSEVKDKKNKEVSLNNQQHMTMEELDKQKNNDKVQHDPSGLNLRTRTISSTSIPTTMHQTTVSTAPSGVQSIRTTVTIPGRRPRGRPPRQKKPLPQTTSEPVESAASSLERLQQQQNKINQCNGSHDYNRDQENSVKNIEPTSSKSDKSILLPDGTQSKEYALLIIEDIFKTKAYAHKRKQYNIPEVACKKRLLDSDTRNDSLVSESNSTENSSLPSKSNGEVHYSFLTGCSTSDWCQQQKNSYSFFYGSTYWPANWEYSAAALTGHVQKKSSKDSLRKIRLLSGEGTTTKINSTLPPPLKSISTFKKHQTSVVQRRGTACKFTQPSIDLTSGSKLNPSIPPVIVRRPGRPPGKKNKLQSVLKSNCPRKSPRQHASTLAAILSGKSLGSNDKLVGQQTGQAIDFGIESNKNSLDVDGPCILKMAVPKHEHKSGFRHHRHRRQLDHQHNIIKRRRRRRSITPPPPKLCAQQPAPQHIPINDSVVDQETVKLRTKHVDVVRRRARDERLRAAFVCQQLHKVQEIAEQNRRNVAEEDLQTHDVIEQDFSCLPQERSQSEIWSSLEFENDREPDNMCLQIMYEQTADKKFLCSNLSDDTLQMYHQQRELALAERLTNNYNGDNVFSDFGTDMISTANKRKKKRPNMTGWPKEKRRKVIASTISMATDTLNGDSDVERNDIMLKRRRAAAAKQQKLRRQRIKLEQLQLAAKEKTKDKAALPTLPKRRRGRRPGPLKKNKTTIYRRRKTSVSSNGTTASSNTSNTNTEIKEKKLTVKRQRRKRLISENKTTAPVPVSTVEPTVVKRSCGRPRGSLGRRQRWKLKRLHLNQTPLSPEQQKENVVMPQTSSGKLKCVISTRNNRMKLLPSSSSSSSILSSPKKIISGNKSKKSAVAYNLSSCLETLSSPVAVVGKTTRTTKKRKRLQQQQLQQMATTTVTWDVGRPKRYHSANHSRNAGGVAVEEDCCFVGSQPFEQHCPGVGGGLSHNTVLENQQYQKENTVHNADL